MKHYVFTMTYAPTDAGQPRYDYNFAFRSATKKQAEEMVRASNRQRDALGRERATFAFFNRAMAVEKFGESAVAGYDQTPLR
jgi:hypothetical protein